MCTHYPVKERGLRWFGKISLPPLVGPEGLHHAVSTTSIVLINNLEHWSASTSLFLSVTSVNYSIELYFAIILAMKIDVAIMNLKAGEHSCPVWVVAVTSSGSQLAGAVLPRCNVVIGTWATIHRAGALDQVVGATAAYILWQAVYYPPLVVDPCHHVVQPLAVDSRAHVGWSPIICVNFEPFSHISGVLNLESSAGTELHVVAHAAVIVSEGHRWDKNDGDGSLDHLVSQSSEYPGLTAGGPW